MSADVARQPRPSIWRRKRVLDRETDQLQQLPLPSRNLRKLDGIQMLRAFAVASVAWMHSGQLVLRLRRGRPLPDLGISGVDLFFVISGFILCLLALRDKRNVPGIQAAWNFLQRRIARIFPIYWIFAAPFTWRLVHYRWHEIRSYVPGLFLLPSDSYPELKVLANFSWTLVFEMFFYLTLAAVLTRTVRRAPAILIALLVLLVTVGTIIDIHRPLLIVICNPMLLEFAFGGIVAILYAKVGSGHRIASLLVVIGALGAGLLAAMRFPWIGQYQFDILTNTGVLARALTWGLACALVVAGVVLWGPSLDSPFGRLSVALGNASYSTYLLSGLAFLYLDRVFIAAARHGSVNNWVASGLQAATLVSVMLAGLVFYRFIEQPLIRWSYRRLSGD